MRDAVELTPEERDAVETAWARAGSAPVAQRLQGVGCLVAFAGMAALTLTPALGNYLELSPESAYGVLALAVALLGIGAALGLLGASRGGRSFRGEIDASIARVVSAHRAGGAGMAAESATLLARLRSAPPEAALPPEETARRLGPALADVRRIQRYLVARGHLPSP